MLDLQRPEEATEGRRGASEGLPEPLGEEAYPHFNSPPGTSARAKARPRPLQLLPSQDPRDTELFFSVSLNPEEGLEMGLVLHLHQRQNQKKKKKPSLRALEKA